ncbi:MAG: guanylate kinase [Lachnospiraceae bacterium]|nr:guanylate kinase [Lachnospiraceae bacterium]
MGKIIYIMGKSSSGKDTIFRELQKTDVKLFTIVPYTTRPIRAGEKDGVEYHFTTEDEFHNLEAAGKVIEARVYNTYYGKWRYFTVDDGQIDLINKDYILIGTLESYVKTVAYFGKDKIIPVMIELDDGIRLQRALNRERAQIEPKYEELCRRFLADAEDFSKEKLKQAGITRTFENNSLIDCVKEIKAHIQITLSK